MRTDGTHSSSVPKTREPGMTREETGVPGQAVRQAANPASPLFTPFGLSAFSELDIAKASWASAPFCPSIPMLIAQMCLGIMVKQLS